MSKIPWCDMVINVMHGCEKISTGCLKCFAERFSKRLAGMGVRGYRKEAPFAPTPHPWNIEKLRKIPGKGKIVFLDSMGDLFIIWISRLSNVWSSRDYVTDVMQAVRATQQHTFIVCTKRSGRMLDFFNVYEAPPNLIALVSVENQEMADKRIPELRRTRVAVRGLSVEPMLTPIDLCLSPGMEISADCAHRGIHWVVCGPETGPGKRPFDPAWAEDLWRQCRDAGVPFFWKPNDGFLPREFPGG